MNTPNDIKKGLETCIGKCTGNKPHCPYHTCGDGCMDSMNRDALAYIQQLESRLAQAERERDAAVADITAMLETSDCEVRHVYCSRSTPPFECDTDECKGYARWRGVCEEPTKDCADV